MKEQTKILLLMIFTFALAACGSVSGDSNETNQTKTAAPSIKIRAEELTEEWKANPAAADEKYADKKLEIQGETSFVEITGENAVIKLNSGEPKILCHIEATDGTDKLQKILADSRIPKPIKITVEGVYLKASADKSAIEIKPCEPPYLFQ